ncbi:hypothetical protein M0R45_025708 [Rubus argutus]|uniref:DNA-directed RNA polymerase III subunit RPC5 n=1 Tax=Rubus argutus TaxID=59490 RepID=A0AAW1WWT0_RUBAR
MTKQTLCTEWDPCLSTGYAVGVLMGNKLHLNPVHEVVQLHPSLEHLKPGGSKRKDRVTGDTEVTVKRENFSEEKSLAPSKKQNKRAESSTEDEEVLFVSNLSWVPLEYHGSESDFSARYLKRMVVQESSPIEFTMTPYDYVNSLCPRTCKGSSKRALLNLPLEERIQKLLLEELLARQFSDIKKPSTRDWKFKEQSDASFSELYPEIAESQEQIWERMDKELVEAIKPHRDMKNASMTGKSPNQIGPCKSASEVHSGGGSTMSDETQAALPEAIKEVLQIHKVCNFQLICYGFHRLAVGRSALPKVDPKNKTLIAAQNGLEDPPEELQKVIAQVAVNIDAAYVLISSPDHPEHNQLRNIVIQLLQGKNKGPLKKADVTTAAQQELGREISNNEYSKVMNEICVSKSSAWYLKSGDGGAK